MKCPKCGYVSYPGRPECKRCGYRFVEAEEQESYAPPQRTEPSFPQAETSPSSPLESAPEPLLGDSGPTMAAADEPLPAEAPDSGRLQAESPPAREASDWRDELANRLQSFRRRRSRQGTENESMISLNLNFPEAAEGEEASEAAGRVVEFPQSETEADLKPEQPIPIDHEMQGTEAAPLEEPPEELGTLSSAAIQAGEVPLERESRKSDPMEIEVEVPRLFQPWSDESEYLPLSPAPLSQRFLAGAADALTLLMGAALFALIFWRAGGRLSLRPLDLTVLAVIAAFFILAYFGAFTALVSSTPGLLWLGLEIRNYRGERPGPREAFWRAFGYLVSMSALMMGFVWAWLDSDGLTWHDRMSGTFSVSMSRRGAPSK